MRKRIVSALIFILLSVCMQAQSISGTWCQSAEESKDGMSMEMRETMILDQNGQIKETNDIRIEFSDDKSSEKLAIKFRILCGGKWQYADGILIQTFEVKTLKTEFLEKPEDLPDVFSNMITKAITSEFKKAARKPIRSKVLSLTSDSLKVKEMDNKYSKEETYSRKAK